MQTWRMPPTTTTRQHDIDIDIDMVYNVLQFTWKATCVIDWHSRHCVVVRSQPEKEI